jgi:hypothetical protein
MTFPHRFIWKIIECKFAGGVMLRHCLSRQSVKASLQGAGKIYEILRYLQATFRQAQRPIDRKHQTTGSIWEQNKRLIY